MLPLRKRCLATGLVEYFGLVRELVWELRNETWAFLVQISGGTNLLVHWLRQKETLLTLLDRLLCLSVGGEHVDLGLR